MIIGLCSEKGGSGKSTLAINLAAILSETAPTTLVDADPQATASQWASLRESIPFGIFQPNPNSIFDEIARLETEHAVIDLPPRTDAVFKTAMLISSHILIPMTASGADLWSNLAVLDLLPALQDSREDPLKVALVLSRWPSRSKLARSVEETARSQSVPVIFGTSQRIAYVEALTAGQTVFEHDPAGIPAQEIRNLLTALGGL